MSKTHQERSERGGIIASLVALLFVVALCVTVYLARHPIMRFAAESWIVNEPTAHADAILVLGDDNFYADRATEAAQLFRQNVAPIVVASGRRLRPSAGISELMEHDLIERGVPKNKIERFAHDGENTREEAMALEHLAIRKGVEERSSCDLELSHPASPLHFPKSVLPRSGSERRERPGWRF